ncbi:MAG: hypothetical protein RSH52_16400 [Janthinobacterium sp.]|uniref:hypothetical protein n=1 Tax=unclassified Janthinobacterium TaxID=2610881 RepID=UPI001D02BF78|nr:hypothetical protein [Janthinobacterium sp. FT68W]
MSVPDDKLGASVGSPALELLYNNKEETMRDVVNEVYKKMKVGSIAWVRPVAAKGDTLETFQSSYEHAKALADEGLITIGDVKRQADNMIEAIRIHRIA